jgi:hypothetical protein
VVTCSGDVPGNVVLFDFESDAELNQLYWKCYTLFSLSNEHVTHGTRSLRMELYPSNYPGLTPKLEVNDWRKFKAIYFDVYSPEKEEIMINVRIDDQKENPDYADRYNKQFILKPGQNQIRIPLGSLITSGTHRQLNLETIYKFIIFMGHPQKKHVLNVDFIRLLS